MAGPNTTGLPNTEDYNLGRGIIYIAEIDFNNLDVNNIGSWPGVVKALLLIILFGLVRNLPMGVLVVAMLGLFASRPGARGWRRHLSENAYRKEATAEVLGRIVIDPAMQTFIECRDDNNESAPAQAFCGPG